MLIADVSHFGHSLDRLSKQTLVVGLNVLYKKITNSFS